MNYYLLCFGRTEFTKITIDAILRCANKPAKIHIINNGWNRGLVPKEILSNWQDFVNDYKKMGFIHNIIEIDKPTSGFALDAFNIAANDNDDEYYWITDNDVLVNHKGFDEYCKTQMDSHVSLSKLGVDFKRTISFALLSEFSDHIPDFKHYMLGSPNDRFSPNGMEQDHCESVNKTKTYYENNPNITNNFTDTTLSIVRKGKSVSQYSDRVSYSVANIKMLHMGYLESNYFSVNKLSVLEMMHYMNLRPMILTEFKEDYENRKNKYISNLIGSGNIELIELYNRIIRSEY